MLLVSELSVSEPVDKEGCEPEHGNSVSGQLTNDYRRTGYAVILSIEVYVILDLEFPRLGLIRVDAFDRYLVEVRNTMK